MRKRRSHPYQLDDSRRVQNLLALEMWRSHWTPSDWRNYLAAGESEARLAVIRRRTHTGRPLGSAEFIQCMEKVAQRRLTPQKRGPLEKIVIDRSQGELTFES
jgi:hypothetical protein